MYDHLEIVYHNNLEFYLIPDEDPKFRIYVLKSKPEFYKSFIINDYYIDFIIISSPCGYSYGWDSNVFGNRKVASNNNKCINLFDCYKKAIEDLLKYYTKPTHFMNKRFINEILNDINPEDLFS